MYRWVFTAGNQVWITYIVVMVLLLIAMVGLWQQHFNNDLEVVKLDVHHETDLLASITTEALRRGQYQYVDEILKNWGQSGNQVKEIKVTAQNGSLIGKYDRSRSADHIMEVSIPIDYSYQGHATLTLRYDLDGVYRQSHTFTLQLASAYVILGILLGIVAALTRSLKKETQQLKAQSILLNQTNDILRKENTERKRAEERVHYLAYYDALTQLPNRSMFMERLQRAMSSSARSLEYAVLLYIDLDNFKSLNDTHGHNYGDLMLAEVAHRLVDCVRDVDTVARLGGDEFVVLVEGLHKANAQASEQAILIGEKIREAITRPYFLEGVEFHSSASLGSILFLGDAIKLDDLCRHADSAMYQAKDAGRNTLRFFDPIMQHELEIHTRLETDLRYALTGGQLHLNYQKQVDMRATVIGAEVMLRWMHPKDGLISPSKFIPIAEHSGLIEPIGAWVLETACQQIKSWESELHTKHLHLSINVSARQFGKAKFVADLMAIIQNIGIKPNMIKLELTESLVLDNIEASIQKMNELREFGVRISMDDFGTGQSSLTYLRRLPLDQIKIDQSFIRDIPTNMSDAAIVKTIIMMANNLDIEVIAEGVETEQQREFLRQNGCYLYQGYLFGKPVPIEEFAVT